MLALASLLLTAASVRAQDKADRLERGDADDASVEAAGDTPRGALTRFFELSRRGDYPEAAKFLELPQDVDPERGPELAKRLKLVLDHYTWFDMSKISNAPNGSTSDGLSNGVDEITRLPIGDSLTAPVRLVRRSAEARWLFSRVTVARVDSWYSGLPNRFWLDLMPEPLLRMGPEDLLWGQWAAMPLFVFIAWAIGVALSRATQRVLAPFVKRTSATWDNALVTQMASPLTLLFALLVAYALLPVLGLYPPAHSFFTRALHAVMLATIFWAIARSVDVAGQMFSQSSWGTGAPATRAMLLFASRIMKVLVAAFALVTLFSELGYPVTSLLAGLGVGGIAVALSAQKSLENLIGAFSIAVDQPFREGDFVKVDGMSGTVELIGMRSTRIRTAERTLVSIPNGKLADMRIETYAPRDRCRMDFKFGLTLATTEAQVRNVLEQLDKLLANHKKIWPSGRGVRFATLGDYSLVFEAGCWFATADFDEFTLIRQDILLGLMKIVEGCGASFAVPTRSVLLDSGQESSSTNNADSPVTFTEPQPAP